MAVLKRQRELKKAEKAALKRERREQRASGSRESEVATKDDLAGYGFDEDIPEDEEKQA